MVTPGGGFVFTSYLVDMPLSDRSVLRQQICCRRARLIHEENSPQGLLSVAVDPGRVQSEMLKAAAETDDVSECNTALMAGEALWSLITTMTPERSGRTIALSGRNLNVRREACSCVIRRPRVRAHYCTFLFPLPTLDWGHAMCGWL